MSEANTIILKGCGIRKERRAATAIMPGHLVEITADNEVQAHSTVSGFAQKGFAVEDDLQGKTIEDAYSTGSAVQYNIMRTGDEVNVLIADGETITVGTQLVSAGDGTLQALGSETADETTVAIAVEAVTTSGSTGRCAAEVV